MARNHTAAVAVGLGVGGGALLWYLFRGHKDGKPTPTAVTSSASTTASLPSSGSSPPATSPPSTMPGAPPGTSPTAPVRTPGACQLRLDTNGVTSGGAPLTVAGAVDLCKPAGKADLVYAHDAPAASLTDVYRALTDAGVSVVVWAP